MPGTPLTLAIIGDPERLGIDTRALLVGGLQVRRYADLTQMLRRRDIPTDALIMEEAWCPSPREIRTTTRVVWPGALLLAGRSPRPEARLAALRAGAQAVIDPPALGSLGLIWEIRCAVARQVRSKRERASAAIDVHRLVCCMEIAGGAMEDVGGVVGSIAEHLEPLLCVLDEVDVSVRSAVACALEAAWHAEDILGRATQSQPGRTPRTARIPDILGGLNATLRRMCAPGVQIEVSVPKELPRVIGDPGEIARALLNVCTSATDAMPDGGSIQIEATAADVLRTLQAEGGPVRPGRYVQLRVRELGRRGVVPEFCGPLVEQLVTACDGRVHVEPLTDGRRVIFYLRALG